MRIVNQRNLCYIVVSLFSISAPVLANQLPWQNPYVGVYLGGGFGNNHVSTNTGSDTNTSYFTTSADINAVNSAGGWQKEPNAMIMGLQMGHDWIWNQMAYGVALDYGTLPLSSSSTVNSTYPDNSDKYSIGTSISTNWLFTLRGKLGYPKMLKYPSLFYLTGGMALTKLKVSHHFNDNSSLAGAGVSDSAQNQIGWTIGAGIDVAAFKHTSVNLEYLYIDMPSIKTTSSISNTQAGFGIPEQSLISPFSTQGKFYANLLKIGLNYRFDE